MNSTSHRRRPWRIGRFVCGLATVIGAMATVIGAMATVTAVASAQVANPPLKAECGLKVALVLDESASIANPGGALGDQTAAVRGAADAFVTSLENTGSPVALTAFSISARNGVVPYTEVTQQTLSSFTNWINNTNVNGAGYNPGAANRAGTNWEEGLLHAQEVAGGPPDLMVFVTDGNPNRYVGSTAVNTTTALSRAVTAAEKVKSAGTRIFAIGVGTAVGTPAHAENIRAISGNTEFTGGNFATADYSLVENFDDLKSELTGIVASLCGSRLVITKSVLDHAGEPVDASGWNFTATLDPTPGHTWLAPAPAGASHSASLTTNAEGIADFQWRLETGDEAATLSVTHETEKSGFHFVLARCQTHRADGTLGESEESTVEIPGATLGRAEFRTCEVLNSQAVGQLTVVKRLLPGTDPGRFDLLVDGIPRLDDAGDGDSTGPLALPLGTHTVGERITAAEEHENSLSDYSIATTCVNETDGGEVAHGTGSQPVSVDLRSATDKIVCTITNRRIGPEPSFPPPPGGPDVPSPPCPDHQADSPECKTEAGRQPQLEVVKRMPARARVGERVPIAIAVRNVGRGTADGVRLHETPPDGGRVVAVADHGSLQHDGTVVWDLGSLPPGATRTVHATMLVTGTGSLLDTAVAGAVNADPALGDAVVRVGAAPRPSPPAVTG